MFSLLKRNHCWHRFTQQQTAEADLMRGCLSDYWGNWGSPYPSLETLVFLTAPKASICSLPPTPLPLLINVCYTRLPYWGNVGRDNLLSHPLQSHLPPLSGGSSPSCVSWPPRSPSAMQVAFLPLSFIFHQEPSLALCCLCSSYNDWLQLYFSSSLCYLPL